MARLELRSVSKTYAGGIVAAQGVDLTVEDGELFVIVGPSGSGKSTALRLVAGLEDLDAGSIHLDGRRIDEVPPARRDVAMVFQDQVLYPHLNVAENIGFGLRARRVARDEMTARVHETAATLGLDDCLTRSPATLSGGQRRRVTLGRALVLRPRLFLFDEPFSGLDAPLRASTRAELADLNRQTGATMVLVTHDQGEALALGHRVAVIDRGRVVQVGRPLDLYDRPANRFVAQFLGQPTMNLLPGSLLPGTAPSGLTAAEVGFRPEHVSLLGTDRGSPGLSATIRRLEPLGHETLAYLECGPHTLSARLPARSPWQAGDRVAIDLDLARASWFDATTGLRVDTGTTLADGGGPVA